MRKVSKFKLGVVAASTLALAIGIAGPASADSYPNTNDATIGGSDTIQFTLNFLADGTAGGVPGWNQGKTSRIYSFDATADANGRAVYDSAGVALTPTIVMRAGNNPVTRPNGSHGGAKALFQDAYFSGGNHLTGAPMENIARMSGLPFCTSEDAAAATAGFGGLHLFRIANEVLSAAVTNSTTAPSNAPATITRADLLGIYTGTITTWNQIPGNSGGSTAAIIPLIPQTGSGTRSAFLADLQAQNGGTPITLVGTAVTVQENDYTALNDPNRIAPFSNGRIALNNSGFFGTAATGAVKALGSYSYARSMYLVTRQSDIASTTPFLGTANLVTAFISSIATGIRSATYSANISAAGQTQSYADLGRANTPGVTCDASA